MEVIKVENVSFKYSKKGKFALRNVSFSVEKGDFFILLGPNGSGKSTLIKIIAAFLKPTNGTVLIYNVDNLNLPSKIRRKLGVLTDDLGLIDTLTSYEMLYATGRLLGMRREEAKEKVSNILRFLEMEEFSEVRVGELSTGLKKRVALGQLLMRDPEILLLDEPTAGLDPKSSKKIRDLLKKLHESKQVTIVYATHLLDEVEPLYTKVCILVYGEVKFLCSREEYNPPHLREIYYSVVK